MGEGDYSSHRLTTVEQQTIATHDSVQWALISPVKIRLDSLIIWELGWKLLQELCGTPSASVPSDHHSEACRCSVADQVHSLMSTVYLLLMATARRIVHEVTKGSTVTRSQFKGAPLANGGMGGCSSDSSEGNRRSNLVAAKVDCYLYTQPHCGGCSTTWWGLNVLLKRG